MSKKPTAFTRKKRKVGELNEFIDEGRSYPGVTNPFIMLTHKYTTDTPSEYLDRALELKKDIIHKMETSENDYNNHYILKKLNQNFPTEIVDNVLSDYIFSPEHLYTQRLNKRYKRYKTRMEDFFINDDDDDSNNNNNTGSGIHKRKKKKTKSKRKLKRKYKRKS